MIGIRGAKYGSENKGESIGVTDETGSPIGGASKRSLKVQDAPGLKRSYDPVLDIYPKWDSGTFHVGFDIMAQPGADWFFEMRDGNGGEFAAGPYLRWQKGTLVANNNASQKLADVKPGEWLRIDLTATTGTAKYDVTLTRQDGTKTEIKAIPCKPTWATARSERILVISTLSKASLLHHSRMAPAISAAIRAM